MKWKRKLKETFGLRGEMKLKVPLNHRAQADKMLEEEKTPAPRLDERLMQSTVEPGPVNKRLPETTETKRGIFPRTEGVPYFTNSHMVTHDAASDRNTTNKVPYGN